MWRHHGDAHSHWHEYAKGTQRSRPAGVTTNTVRVRHVIDSDWAGPVRERVPTTRIDRLTMPVHSASGLKCSVMETLHSLLKNALHRSMMFKHPESGGLKHTWDPKQQRYCKKTRWGILNLNFAIQILLHQFFVAKTLQNGILEWLYIPRVIIFEELGIVGIWNIELHSIVEIPRLFQRVFFCKEEKYFSACRMHRGTMCSK